VWYFRDIATLGKCLWHERSIMTEQFMQRAIAIARESLDAPGTLPYGAVVVKDGKIIGEGLNRSLLLCDPTSHGEMEAIRDACRRLGSVDLVGCELYTSSEPCSMCVATSYITGITKLYYGSSVADSMAFFSKLAERDPKWARRFSPLDVRRDVGLPVDQRVMPSQQLLKNDANDVFESFALRIGSDRPDHKN